MTFGAFITSIFFKIDRVLLIRVVDTNKTRLTREAVINIQVSARLAIFGFKAADSRAG